MAYINNYAIPSFAVNGTSCVVAEDLQNFGFDVLWNAYARTLSITRNGRIYPKEMFFCKDQKHGTKFSNVYQTDIVTYSGNYRITSYSMDGYTLIPIEELSAFGSVAWNGDERTLSLWVDGLHIRNSQQLIFDRLYDYDYLGRWIVDTGEFISLDNGYVHALYFQDYNNNYVLYYDGEEECISFLMFKNVDAQGNPKGGNVQVFYGAYEDLVGVTFKDSNGFYGSTGVSPMLINRNMYLDFDTNSNNPSVFKANGKNAFVEMMDYFDSEFYYGDSSIYLQQLFGSYK